MSIACSQNLVHRGSILDSLEEAISYVRARNVETETGE
jgi:hypothetical protein